MGLFSELGNISKATVSAVSPEGKIGGVIDENIQLSAKDFAGIAGTVGGRGKSVWYGCSFIGDGLVFYLQGRPRDSFVETHCSTKHHWLSVA